MEVAPRFPRSGSGFPRVPRAGFLARGFRHFHVLVLARPRFGLTSTQAASGFGCGSGCGNFGGIGSAFSALRWNGSALPLENDPTGLPEPLGLFPAPKNGGKKKLGPPGPLLGAALKGMLH